MPRAEGLYFPLKLALIDPDPLRMDDFSIISHGGKNRGQSRRLDETPE